MARGQSLSLGIDGDSNSEEPINEYFQKPLGSRSDLKSPKSAGVRTTNRSNTDLTDILGVIASKFSIIAGAIVGESTSNLEQLVQIEVHRALASTNKSIAQLKEILLSRK